MPEVQVRPTEIMAAAGSCRRPAEACSDQVDPGNHFAVIRSPIILPKIDSTTDQPIQYPNAPIGPASENRPRQPS